MLELQSVLLTEEAIQTRVRALAAELRDVYATANPLVLCVLKGAFVFAADLVRAMDIPLELDFVQLSSYGGGTRAGALTVAKDASACVEGRDILVVEDILDTGASMQYLTRRLREQNARSVRVCVLIDKPARRTVDFSADYVGFEIPDTFIVGYGLDYAERYRALPYIGVLGEGSRRLD